MSKSTVQEIRERFDKNVERFSNLEVGQSAQIDSPLALELVALRRGHYLTQLKDAAYRDQATSSVNRNVKSVLLECSMLTSSSADSAPSC
jgi:hypothetical protein